MRPLPLVLAGIAIAALVEVVVNVVARPQEGPPALAAVLEPYLLAAGVVAMVVAMLLTLGDRGPGPSRLRLLAVIVIVVGVVRLGDEWWSPAAEPSQPATASASPAAMPGLRVMTWNLESGSRPAATSVAGIVDMEPRPDLVALQELTPDVATALGDDPAIRSAYPYRILTARSGVAGMGILSRYPLVVGTSSTDPVVLRAGLLLPDGSGVEVFDVHPYPPAITRTAGVPTGLDTRRRDADLATIADAVARVDAGTPVLVVGDLNTSPFEPGYAILADPLTDAHEAVGTGTGFTWRPSSVEALHAGFLRIDHVLTGPGLAPTAVSEDCSLAGDHCRLLVTLRTGAGP
jgi:endonuclease/exonuclease/phosphatase (EEP) superfamily protein YafD